MGNKFSGTIPDIFGSLTNLELLHLHHNSFTGPVPASLGQTYHLQSFAVENNPLAGSMPLGVCSLVMKGNLTHLSVDCIKLKNGGESTGVECNCCTECYFD